jgi:tight adherence protein B
MNILQIALIFLIVLILAVLGGLWMTNRDNARKKHMLSKIKGHSVSERVSANPQKGLQDKRRAEIAKKLRDSKEDDQKGIKKKATLTMMIEQAGMKISVKQYWLFSVLSMIALVMLAKITGQGPFVLVMATVIGLLGVPRFVLKRKAAKRQKKFLEEFPDALEATVRLLKAGMPVAEAISMISREFSGPVGEEMSIVYDKQKIGIPLHEAALEATRRMPLTEMQMFATGLSIQAQTGSSLSEVLTNLSNVIRSRFRLKRKIKALSSEAIASASIIAALPILVATGMYFINYEYMEPLFTTGTGNMLLGGAITWMFMGVLVMRAMINFKI